MNYKDFRKVHDAARLELKRLEGDDNFPGLGQYDRVYALPPDCFGWKCLAIFRASDAYPGDPEPMVTVSVHSYRHSHLVEPKAHEMTASQYEAIAHIKRTVASWLRGNIERLPPSTSDFWSRDAEG